jgi:hypothetical protein
MFPAFLIMATCRQVLSSGSVASDKTSRNPKLVSTQWWKRDKLLILPVPEIELQSFTPQSVTYLLKNPSSI